MPILNYTTEVPVEKSIATIHTCLAKHNAKAILNEYQDGYIVAISFRIALDGNDIAFRLPSDWQPIKQVLAQDPKTRNTKFNSQEQALRVTWRIVKDWVEAQMAIVETKMVKTEQVFLPYAIMKDGRTLSEHAISDPKFLLEQ